MSTHTINRISRLFGLVTCLILLVAFRHYTEWSWLVRVGVALGTTVLLTLVLVFTLGCFSKEEEESTVEKDEV